jgi:hypothetical protein
MRAGIETCGHRFSLRFSVLHFFACEKDYARFRKGQEQQAGNGGRSFFNWPLFN